MEQAVDLCKCENRVCRPDSIPAERLKYIDYFSNFSYCDIVKNEIEKQRQNNPEFKKAWDESRAEYKLIGEMISLRKQENITQKE